MRLPFIPKVWVQTIINLHPVVCDDGKYWVWVGTHWEPVKDIFTWFTEKLELHKIWRKSAAGVKQTIPASSSLVGSALRDYIPRSPDLNRKHFFEQFRGKDLAPRGISLRNGFLRFNHDGTTELQPHSHTQRCRYYLDAEYTPDADCPYTKMILHSYFIEDKDNDGPAKERVIWEFMALCLFGMANADNRGIILGIEGAKFSGKSTFFEHLVDAVYDGKSTDTEHGMVSSVDPHVFGQMRHNTLMVGTLLNYKDEIGKRAVKDEGDVKAVVSGGPVSVQWLYKDYTTARLRCGHLFVCNKLPIFSDPSGALHSRLVRIWFNRYKRGDEPAIIIGQKMKAERVGIIAHLCRVYQEMVERSPHKVPTLAVPESSLRYQRIAALEANTLQQFLEECTQFDEKGEKPIPATRLLQAYTDWANLQGISKRLEVSAKMLMDAIDELMPNAISKKMGRGGARLYNLILVAGQTPTETAKVINEDIT